MTIHPCYCVIIERFGDPIPAWSRSWPSSYCPYHANKALEDLMHKLRLVESIKAAESPGHSHD